MNVEEDFRDIELDVVLILDILLEKNSYNIQIKNIMLFVVYFFFNVVNYNNQYVD